MKLSPEAMETMGESANDGLIHPYVWGPALVGAAQQIKELQAALSTAEADRKALMEALKPFAKLGAEPPQPGFIYRDVHIDYLRDAAKVMGRLRSEAEGKAAP